METMSPGGPPKGIAPERGPRVSLWSLRVLLTAHLVAALLQPVLAGLFLAGDVDAVTWHGIVGSLVALLGLTAAVTGVVYVLGGRGRWWVLPVLSLVTIADTVQVGLGFAGVLGAHVPLGVAVVTGAVLLAVWVWSPSALRTR